MNSALPFYYLNIQFRKSPLEILLFMYEPRYRAKGTPEYAHRQRPFPGRVLAVSICLLVMGIVLMQGIATPEPTQKPTEANSLLFPSALTRQKPQQPIKVTPPPVAKDSAASESLSPLRTNGNRIHVLVTGEPEAGEVLTFFLHPYEKEYDYHLYFGDGDKLMALSRNRHRYERPGNYQLEVVVLSQQDTLSHQKFTLYIRPSIAVHGQTEIGGQFPSHTGGMPMPRQGEEDGEEVKIIDHGTWQNESEAPDYDRPIMFAEEMPSFPGGTSALQSFLNRTVSYPEEARASAIEGKVVVQFVVHRDGSISDIKFIRELGYGCEDAVLHALARMPHWIPGRHQGQSVAVHYVLPVNFELR